MRRLSARGTWLILTWFAASSCVDSRDEPASVPTVDGVRWRSLQPAPTPRTEVAAASDGDRIFVVGGFTETEATVPTVEVFEPEAEVWSQGPDLPVAVNHAMATALEGTVYVLGGYLGPGLSNPSDRVFALRGGRWQELAPMPEPRAAGGSAAVDGLLYVAGGVGPEGLAEAVLVFDPNAGRWSMEEGPPTGREHLGVAGFDGRLFVVGGRTGGIGSNLDVAESYDVAGGRWIGLDDMPTARGGIAAAATADGYVVAAGGEADTTFEEVEAYDVEAARWLSLPPLPTPRHGLGVVALGTVVYVVAGGPQPGLSVSNAVEAIDLAPLRS